MKNLNANAVFTLLAPTASGKTDIMIKWARKYPIEIVSVDSAMVYRELSIGANKPSLEELRCCPHHVINVTSIPDSYDVGRFFDDSALAIDDIMSRGKIPVLVGGTMMYVYQINKGLAQIPSVDKKKRACFIEAFEKTPLEVSFQQLQLCDPIFAAGVSSCDKQRISRGLEVFYLTGKPLSTYWQEPAKKYPYALSIHGLLPSNQQRHKEKISARAHAMLENGFIDEAQDLKTSYGSLDYEFWAFVGYRQVRSFLDGQIRSCDLPEEIEKSTWQLVKRQKTWLKKFQVPLWEIDFLQGEFHPELSNIFEKYCTFVLEQGLSRL